MKQIETRLNCNSEIEVKILCRTIFEKRTIHIVVHGECNSFPITLDIEKSKQERSYKSGSKRKWFKETQLANFLSRHTSAGKVLRYIGLITLSIGGLNAAGVGLEVNQLIIDSSSLMATFNELILLIGAILTTLSHIVVRFEYYKSISRDK